MLTNIRFLPFCFLATVITLVCFLCMSMMVQNPQKPLKSSFKESSFTLLKEFKKPLTITPPKAPKKVEKQVVKQPPAAPKLNIATDQSRPTIDIPMGLAKPTPEIMNSYHGIGMVGPGTTPNNFHSDQGLIPLVFIEPVYPPKAIINKIEGWVKVKFKINEYGKVIKASVVEAKPRNIFNKASIKAIYRSQYKPVIINGKSSAATAEQVIYFNLPKQNNSASK